MSDTQSAGTALPLVTCRERLAGSQRGFLACTERGLPSVLPVDLRLDEGRLLVVAEGSYLEGQVVALTVGKRALLCCRGWTVIARGSLGSEVSGTYPMEIATLDGTNIPRPKLRRGP